MPLWVNCDHCRKKIRARDAVANTAKCPQCGHLQWVPDEKPQAAAEAWGGGAFSNKSAAAVGQETQTQTPRRGLESLLGEDHIAFEIGFADTASKAGTEERQAPSPEQRRKSGVFEHSYWALILTLIPLALSLFSHDKKDLVERFERTQKNNPAIFEAWESKKHPTLDELIQMLPGRQIEGAYLPRDTWWHWAYSGMAAVVFLVFIVLMFPRSSTNVRDLILIGSFTGIIGVSFLLAVQYVAYYAQGFFVTGGGAITILLLILNFIEFSYRSALDPNMNFPWSFLGFTLGVGLLEELCKALPLLFYYRTCETMSWRGACRWGLASGVGFGVAEAVSYAADFYKGHLCGAFHFLRRLARHLERFGRDHPIQLPAAHSRRLAMERLRLALDPHPGNCHGAARPV